MSHLAPPGATHVDENCVLNLTNIDEEKRAVATYPVPMKYVNDILSYIGYRNAPFDLMLGVLAFVESLFYPTDDEIHDTELSYYRQREWRIISGLGVDGLPHGRLLNQDEKVRLAQIDRGFWNREISDGRESFRRIERIRHRSF
jgi:hypothetical protein